MSKSHPNDGPTFSKAPPKKRPRASRDRELERANRAERLLKDQRRPVVATPRAPGGGDGL